MQMSISRANLNYKWVKPVILKIKISLTYPLFSKFDILIYKNEMYV